MHRIYDEMEQIEKPIVVAHHAACVAAALRCLSCDFRLAAKSACYAFPEGLLASSRLQWRQPINAYCGTHWARYLIMANMRVAADKAMIMGLVHEVFADETF